MKKGKFIVLEGVDGSGKSTQSALLKQALIDAGHAVHGTFEPTNGPIGSVLRNILTHRIKADEKTIAALFLADRLDHIQNEQNGLLKILNQGIHVVCDRYYFSSYAYHSTHIDMDWVIQSNSLCAELLRPDLNIYIDIEPQTSMDRIAKGRTSKDLFENLERITKVREGYFTAFERLKAEEQILVLNGQRKPEIIFQEIWDNVHQMLV
ncbi:MAG: dTMP kinase [Saprospiraceae bacterium]